MRNKMIKKITIAGALLLGTSVIQAQHVIETVRAIQIKADTDKAGGLEGISFYAAGQEMAEFNPSNNIMYKKTFFEENAIFEKSIFGRGDLDVDGKVTFDGKVAIGGNNPLEGLHLYNNNLRIEAGEFQSTGKMILRPDVNNSGDDKISFRNSANTEMASIQDGKIIAKSGQFEANIDVDKTLKVKGTGIFNGFTVIHGDLFSGKTIYGSQQLVLRTVNENGKIVLGKNLSNNEEYSFIEKGHLTAKGVTLDVGSFPDYVFAEDYNLMPLEEVASFIKKNKHLPNMPSEAEVVAKGMNIAQINTILVEKVEELTLHTIKQEEKINTLLQELQAIKKAISATKK
ncbi:conserved exported hypothetical protein [Tenacibaculum sp. 190524A02b]